MAKILRADSLDGDGFRHAMRGEDHRLRGVGHFVEFLDENRAFSLQRLDHIFIVHNLMAHIDGRAIDAQRLLDGVDGAHDPGAKAARGAQKDVQLWLDGHAAARPEMEQL